MHRYFVDLYDYDTVCYYYEYDHLGLMLQVSNRTVREQFEGKLIHLAVL